MMSRPLVFAALLGCAQDDDSASVKVPPPEGCGAEPFDEATLAADLAYFASPELDGRFPGSAGDEAARDVVERRFGCLGLSPILPGGVYQEAFTDGRGRRTANVLAALPGSEETRSDEVILVSAHSDHFGRGRLGANDNASGLSGLLTIAGALVAGPPLRRTVVFAAFGAEESGYEGSEAWYTTSASSVVPTDVVFDLNMDMIGSYNQTDYVYALGTMRGTPGRRVMDTLVDDYPAIDVGLGDWSDLSDNVTFCARGVPYTFLWTEDPDCYHETCDTEDRIDYAHMLDIVRLGAATTAALADSRDDLGAEVQRGRNVCRP